MAATRAARAQLVLLQTGDTPDGLIAGLLDSLYAAESARDASPEAQDAAVTERVCRILIAFYLDAMSRVLTDDERATLQLRLTTLQALATTARTTQTTVTATSGAAVYTFNQDWLEPVGGPL